MDPRAQQLGALLADRFEIVEFLGKGGFAAVYRAKNLRLGRNEALKVLLQNHSDEPDFARRFQQEARTAASLDHPAIIKIYDYGQIEGIFWYSMQYVEGPVLSREMRSLGTLSEDDTARIGIGVLEALEYSHAHGVIHRDVKPDNIILDPDRRPYLMDFGIAKSSDSVVKTQTGFILGSPTYLAPEQLQGRKLDGRADVYALGVTLYEMVSGGVPFTAEDKMGVLMKRLTEAPEPLSRRRRGVSQELERIVMRSLEREREKRYPDARAMRQDLQAFLGLSTEQRGTTDPMLRPVSATSHTSGVLHALPEGARTSVTAHDAYESPTMIGPPARTTQKEAIEPAESTAATALQEPARVAPPRAGLRGPLGILYAALGLGVGIGVSVMLLRGRPAAPAKRLEVPGTPAPAPTSGPQPPPTAVPTPPVPTAVPTLAPTAVATARVERPTARPTEPPRPAPTAAPPVKRPGPPVTQPTYEAVPVEVPADLAAKFGGRSVQLMLTVGADGSIKKVTKLDGVCDECDRLVIDAVKRYRWSPAQDAEGTPVEKTIGVSIPFGVK